MWYDLVMKKKIINKNYLTQQKLGEILSKHFDVKSEVNIEGTRFKSDFKFTHNDWTYRVEFDGDSHFTDIAVMDRDIKKDQAIWKMDKTSSVRIPYFIQLDNYTFNMFFGFEYPEELSLIYPHGFIDSKAKTPAYFSKRGMDRFVAIMRYLAEKWNSVYVDITHSMVHHKKSKDFSYIIPKDCGYPQLESLADYLADADMFNYCDDCRKMLRKFTKMKFNKREESGFGFSF
jgi:hypothetical protein